VGTLQRPGNVEKITRLAQSAEIEFARSGMASAPIESIARRARVSRQFIYSRFGSKHRLYQYIWSRAEKSLFDALAVTKDRHVPPLQAITSFLEAMYDVPSSSPVLGTMMADQATHGTKIFRRDDEPQRRLRAIRSSLDELLRRGRREGVIARDWDRASFYFMAASLIIA